MSEDLINVKPVIPTSWTNLIAVALATPIPNPGQHPSTAGVIWCPPINTIGLSGIGKSQRIKTIGKAIGLPGVHVVFVSTKSPASFEGGMVPTPDGIVMECTLPQARKCIDQGGGLIFFDEANGATPRTQAACLSTLNDRQFGDHMVPAQTRMLLAMNPPEHAAGGFALAAPMANRMGHVWYPSPSKREWGRWLNGLDDEVPNMKDWEGLVLKNWTDQWRVTNSLAQGFITRASDDLFVNQPDPDDPQSGMAWPSYRVWYWALCAVTAGRCVGAPEQTLHDLVHAYCGPAAAAGWSSWLAEADLPTPEEMIRNNWQPDTRRIDRTYAALNNVTSWVCDMSKQDYKNAAQTAEHVWRILERTLNTHLGDLTADCAARLHNTQLGRRGTPAATAKAAADVILRLTDAGYAKLASA